MEEIKEKLFKFYNDVTQDGKIDAASFRQSAMLFSGTQFGKDTTRSHGRMLMGMADFLLFLEERFECRKK